MSPETVAALSAASVAVVSAGGTVMTAVVGRRQPRGQQRRDDFEAVTKRLDKDIARLERRADEHEAEADELRATVHYLARWTRMLVACVRGAGLEPPAQPQPVPVEVQRHLMDLDI